MPDGSKIITLIDQLNAALRGAGVERSSFNEKYTVYSLRHFYAVNTLRNGVGVFEVARNMGTSVQMIQEYYGRQLRLLCLLRDSATSPRISWSLNWLCGQKLVRLGTSGFARQHDSLTLKGPDSQLEIRKCGYKLPVMLCCQGMSFSFDTTVTIETLKSMPSELLRRTTLLCVFGRLPEERQ